MSTIWGCLSTEVNGRTGKIFGKCLIHSKCSLLRDVHSVECSTALAKNSSENKVTHLYWS